jgi:hypothetical protein
VDLEYMNLLEPLAGDVQAWLAEWGASAAETVLRQIEKETLPRRMKVAPKRPNTYFNLPNAVAAVEDARESA